MKIIKHGTKITGRFKCSRCECEFEENIKNCKIVHPVDIETAFVICPDCGKECSLPVSDFTFESLSKVRNKVHVNVDEMNDILYETKYYNIPYGTPEYYTFVEKKFGYTRENSDIC